MLCKHEVVGSIPSGSTRRSIIATESSECSSLESFAFDREDRLRVVCHREEEMHPIVSEREREFDFRGEQPASGRRVTATLSDVFEANWSFYRCDFAAKAKRRCRAVGIDNESDQVP